MTQITGQFQESPKTHFRQLQNQFRVKLAKIAAISAIFTLHFFEIPAPFQGANKLIQNCTDYGLEILDAYSRFTIDIKGIHPTNMDFKKMEKLLAGALIKGGEMENPPKKIIYNPKNASITLTVEIREKGAYIYAESIPTLFGGFPIEPNKYAILECIGRDTEFVAGCLIMRRGVAIIPVFFDFGRYLPTPKIQQKNYCLKAQQYKSCHWVE